MTEEGAAIRVDATLRPEGRAGPLSRSLESMIEYYERHAATWERQALVKARPIAGDHELAERFVRSVTHVVYPAVLPATAIEDVRASKARIEEHVRALGKEATEELAVMVDTFHPLQVTKAAMELDDDRYPYSWLPSEEGSDEARQLADRGPEAFPD